MRRYDMRIAAPYADVADALESLISEAVDTSLAEESPLARGSFGLRAREQATELLLLVDDEDGLAGYRVALGLRELGFHVDEPVETTADALDPVPDALEDVLPAVAPDPAETLTIVDASVPEMPEPA